MNNLPKPPSNLFNVAPGVWGKKDVFVNYYMIQDQVSNGWVLVDAGLKWSHSKIKAMASYLLGTNYKPKAIILTHGHFDHVGSVKSLAEEWDIPIYAHHLEIPYLTGQSSYPPADPTVGGGMMATLSFLYPNTPINIWKHIKVLPADGSIPVLNGWKYIHTPGHSPGHISLYRETDNVLIAGDAFVTTKQESLFSVMFQTKVLTGPPKYFTCDWHSAKFSVEELEKLKPTVAATGHGKPMKGKELQSALQELTTNFYETAIPEQGRYVPYPAITNANGVMYIPEKKPNGNEKALKAFGVTALVALGIVYSSYKRKRKQIEFDNQIEVEYNY